MRRRQIFLGLLIVAIIGCSPLRSPKEKIEERLLRESPLGSSKDEVHQHLTARHAGSIIEGQGPSEVPRKEWFQTEDWHAYLRVKIGSYGYFGFDLLSTDVVAFYVFDRDDRLVEVSVVKYHEGL